MRWNLGLAGLAISWGFIAVLAAAVDLGAGALAFLRLGLAAAALGIGAVACGRAALLRPGRQLPSLVVLGVVQGVHWLLFFEAVKLGSVALAVLTFYLAPLFLAVAAPLVLPEQLSRVALLALVPGAGGIALVALGGDGDGGHGALALLCGIGSGATFAMLVILSKRLLMTRVEPLTVAFWDCLAGAAAVAPALVLADRVLPRGPGEWGAALLLGIVFTGLSTLIYAQLLGHVTAQAAGILTFLEPVAAVLLAWALVGENLGGQALIGGGLVVLAGITVAVLEPAGTRVTEAAAGVGSTTA